MLYHARRHYTTETHGIRSFAICRGSEAWQCLERNKSRCCKLFSVNFNFDFSHKDELESNCATVLFRKHGSRVQYDKLYFRNDTDAQVASRVPICILAARHETRTIEKGGKHAEACFHQLSKNPFVYCATTVASVFQHFLRVTH